MRFMAGTKYIYSNVRWPCADQDLPVVIYCFIIIFLNQSQEKGCKRIVSNFD